MSQVDFFENTAFKKLARLEKWMIRIQQQMEAIQDDLYITKIALGSKVSNNLPREKPTFVIGVKRIEQLTMFGMWEPQ
jgi:hypothetical protein